MADVFATGDTVHLLRGKKIFFFGDSNVRALYKDMVCLLTGNRLLTEAELKGKVETSFLGDTLIRGSPLNKGRQFKEDRQYQQRGFHIEFHFITKCYNEDIEKIFLDIKDARISAPDIVIMNSAMWDVVRWGVRGVDLYKDNMNHLMRLFQSTLPKHTLVLWVTGLPISAESYGGFLIKQIEFTKYTMRFDVMEANMFAHQIISSHGYDLIDFHYHLRMLVHWRCKDGMHWCAKAMRHLTNLVLTHVSLAWDICLPGNFSSSELIKYKEFQVNHADPPVKFPKVPLLGDAPYPLPAFNINVHNPGRGAQQYKHKKRGNFIKNTSGRFEKHNFVSDQNWINQEPEECTPFNNVDSNWSEDTVIEGPCFEFSEDSNNMWDRDTNQCSMNYPPQPGDCTAMNYPPQPGDCTEVDAYYPRGNSFQHRGPNRRNTRGRSRYAPY